MIEALIAIISILATALCSCVGFWLIKSRNYISREEAKNMLTEEAVTQEKMWALKFENTNEMLKQVISVLRENNIVISSFKEELHEFKVELTELRGVLDGIIGKNQKHF